MTCNKRLPASAHQDTADVAKDSIGVHPVTAEPIYNYQVLQRTQSVVVILHWVVTQNSMLRTDASDEVVDMSIDDAHVGHKSSTTTIAHTDIARNQTGGH